LGVLLGQAQFGDLASAKVLVSRITAKSAILEVAPGATGATGVGKVVSKTKNADSDPISHARRGP